MWLVVVFLVLLVVVMLDMVVLVLLLSTTTGVSPSRQSASPESGSPQGASDDKLNIAIMAMHAGSPEQPVENKGRLGDPASLTAWVTVKK